MGLRTAGATETDVTQAIADRTIVRTWPMRGTLHFVASEDVRWLLALLTPRIVASAAGRHRKLELDEAVFARSRKLFIKALEGGKQLARDDMYQVLERGGISTAGQRGYHTLWRLAQEGLLCFASHIGKQPAFALLDEWIPPSKTSPDKEEALGTLALRYFTSHGPATLADFVWWSGLKVTDARAGLAMAAPRLVSETSDGHEYWLGPKTPSLATTTQSLHLLPSFDEYLLGYTDRSAVIDPNDLRRAIAGGVFLPVAILYGKAIGTWRRTRQSQAVNVSLMPFEALNNKGLKAIEQAISRYSHFLNLKVIFRISK